MAKIICKKCGRVISSVDAFCSRCGTPSEVSMRPVSLGGRTMAAAGISASKGRYYGRNLAAGRSASESSKKTDSMDHGHSSFDSICSEEDSSMRREALKSGAEKARAAVRQKQIRSAGAGRKAEGKGSGKKAIAIVVAVGIGISLLSELMGGIYNEFEDAIEGTYYEEAEPDWQADLYAVTSSGDAVLYQMASQIEYRSYVEQSLAVQQMRMEEYQTFFRERIETEISELSPYLSESLGSDNISEACNLYFCGLQSELAALDYIESDPDYYQSCWNTGKAQIASAVTELFEAGMLDITWQQYQPYEEFLTAEATAEV